MIDISRSLGISKSMTLKLLFTLVDAGYLSRNSETNLYSLNIKLFEIGSAVLNQIGRKNELHELLKKLVTATGETAQLAILVDQQVLYLDKVDSPSALRMVTEIGMRRPAYCTGTGKAIMAWRSKEVVDAIMFKGAQKFTEKTITEADKLNAELQKIRDMGYAVDDEENEIGIICIGAAIKSLPGEVVAAISVSGPTTRMCGHVEEIANEVMQITKLASSVWNDEFWM